MFALLFLQVKFEFGVTPIPPSKYQATVAIGNNVFKETSIVSAFQATSLAIYQALIRTEYAFHRMPDALKAHKPDSKSCDLRRSGSRSGVAHGASLDKRSVPCQRTRARPTGSLHTGRK